MRELNAKQNSTCRAEGLVLCREMLTETQTPGSRSCASLGTAVATALGCAMRNLQQREREAIVPPQWKFSRRSKIGSQLFNLFLILIMRGKDHGDHGKVKTSLCFSLSAQRRSCCCETPVCLKKHAVQLGKSAISIKGFFFVCSFSQEKAPYLLLTFLFRCSENM